MNIEKPDVLSDRELLIASEEAISPSKQWSGDLDRVRRKAVATAQRDADYEHEQNTIREIFEEIEEYHKSYRYALIAGSRKEDTYDLHIKCEAWEGYKDKFLIRK